MPGEHRIALLAMEPNIQDGGGAPFSGGVRRFEASLLSDADLAGLEIHVVDLQTKETDAWVAEVEGAAPTVVGFAAHVWSFAPFIDIARRLKRNDPTRTLVFSGPTARPAMFALAPWRDAAACIDALLQGNGELTFREIVRMRDRSRSALVGLPGLYVPTSDGWTSTGEAPVVKADDLTSPIRMKLLPTDRTVPLEIFRGSSPAPAARLEDEPVESVFSADYLTEELRALREGGAPGVHIVDVALNASRPAFRNLATADERVGFFKQAALFAAIDPDRIDDEQLAFLRAVSHVHLNAKLPQLGKDGVNGDRPFRESRFAKVIEELSSFADVAVDMIVGLPGDGPATFRRALERVRELPCKVRIFHCVVLPDDLMRAPASFELRFDPYTLMMRSCLGWSEDALSRERSRLIEMAYREGGEITPDMWSFPGPGEMRRPAASVGTGVVPSGGDVRVDGANALAPAGQELQRVIELGIREATSGGWTFVEASARPGEIVVIMKTRDGALVVEMRPASPTDNAYKVVDGVAFGYRSPRGARMSDGALRLLDRVLQRLHAPARAALGLSSQDGGPSSSRVRRFRATPS